jgi:hypothetical protein
MHFSASSKGKVAGCGRSLETGYKVLEVKKSR